MAAGRIVAGIAAGYVWIVAYCPGLAMRAEAADVAPFAELPEVLVTGSRTVHKAGVDHIDVLTRGGFVHDGTSLQIGGEFVEGMVSLAIDAAIARCRWPKGNPRFEKAGNRSPTIYILVAGAGHGSSKC